MYQIRHRAPRDWALLLLLRAVVGQTSRSIPYDSEDVWYIGTGDMGRELLKRHTL